MAGAKNAPQCFSTQSRFIGSRHLRNIDKSWADTQTKQLDHQWPHNNNNNDKNKIQMLKTSWGKKLNKKLQKQHPQWGRILFLELPKQTIRMSIHCCSGAIKPLPSMRKALGSTPGTENQDKPKCLVWHAYITASEGSWLPRQPGPPNKLQTSLGCKVRSYLKNKNWNEVHFLTKKKKCRGDKQEHMIYTWDKKNK